MKSFYLHLENIAQLILGSECVGIIIIIITHLIAINKLIELFIEHVQKVFLESIRKSFIN